MPRWHVQDFVQQTRGLVSPKVWGWSVNVHADGSAAVSVGGTLLSDLGGTPLVGAALRPGCWLLPGFCQAGLHGCLGVQNAVQMMICLCDAVWECVPVTVCSVCLGLMQCCGWPTF